jgi:uncharacterized protein
LRPAWCCSRQRAIRDPAERVAHFVEVFFPRFAELQVPERHPKWREVNLAASLPGFSRTEAAAAWLNARTAETGTKPIVANPGAVQPASVPEAAMTKGDQEALHRVAALEGSLARESKREEGTKEEFGRSCELGALQGY